MMLTAFSNMETVHIAAYSHLLDTIGMPESEYCAFLQYKEMKDKHDYLQHLRRRHRRGHRQDARHVRRLHRGAAAVRQLRDADELPALQQDEGHGPDRQLVGPRREPSLRRHHQAVPHLREGTRLPDHSRSRKPSSTSARRRSGSRTRSSTSRSSRGPVNGMSAQGDQEVHPLHRRLAPGPARLRADLHGRRAPAPLARPAAQRRRARQLLRDPRDRIFEGRDPRRLERRSGTISTGGRRRRRTRPRTTEPLRLGDGPDMFEASGVAAE